MRPHISMLLGAWLFACLLLTGCHDSIVPLSGAAKASPDKRLIGVWQHKHQNGITYYHVGRLGGKAPEGVMRVVTVSHPNSGELQEPHQLLAFRSDVGGHSHLNIASVTQEQLGSIRKEGWRAGLLDSYILLRYRVDGDALLVLGMNDAAKRKAIAGGKIKGVDKGREGVTFTDTTENLAQFVAATGDDLFSKDVVRLERVKSPNEHDGGSNDP
jgi:hypothetical protein